MGAGPLSIATTTFSSGYARIEAPQRTRRGKRTIECQRKTGLSYPAAILQGPRDAYYGPPGPCPDAAGAIETMQRYGSDHQYREIVNSRLEEHRLGPPRIGFSAKSLPPLVRAMAQ